jgi:hypothetical protein
MSSHSNNDSSCAPEPSRRQYDEGRQIAEAIADPHALESLLSVPLRPPMAFVVWVLASLRERGSVMPLDIACGHELELLLSVDEVTLRFANDCMTLAWLATEPREALRVAA